MHTSINTARGYSYLGLQRAPVVPMVINAGNDCQVFKVTICSCAALQSTTFGAAQRDFFFLPSHGTLIRVFLFFIICFYPN